MLSIEIMDIVKPALWFALFGGVFGIILAVASKIFAVEHDERIDKITEILPGANCGGCGYAGCDAYAEAVVRGEAKIGLCNSGGKACADKMSEILGVDAVETERRAAFVACLGCDGSAKKKYEYEGVDDCVSANKIGAGPMSCKFGCIGLGSCASVCKYDAISVIDGVAVVNPEKCTACSACINICPKGLIALLPYKAGYAVACNSHDKGNDTRSVCDAGCIGCKICEKQCEFSAIKVENNIAVINQELCTSCGSCFEKCPRKIIKKTAEHGIFAYSVQE